MDFRVAQMSKKFKRADAIYNSGPLALMNAGLVEQEVDGGDARDRPPVRPRHVVDVPWRDVSDRPLERVEMEMSLRYRSRFQSHYDEYEPDFSSSSFPSCR